MIDAAAAELCASYRAYVVPTLATYDALLAHGASEGWDEDRLAKIADVQAHGQESLEICRKAGVALGFGTDLLGGMHVHQTSEFAIRAKTLSPLEILRSATSVNADILQMTGRLGVVKPGALADLIVVDGDPLEDLSVFTADGGRVLTVMLGGVLVKTAIAGAA